MAHHWTISSHVESKKTLLQMTEGIQFALLPAAYFLDVCPLFYLCQDHGWCNLSWEYFSYAGFDSDSFSSHHPTSEESECAKGAGSRHSQDSWPQLIKGMSNIIWHYAQHIRGEGEERRGTFRVMVFVFQSNHHTWWSAAFLEMAEDLPDHGNCWMNSLFCFPCVRGFFFTY